MEAEMPSTSGADAILCFIVGRKGYIWNAEGAIRLRKQHHIMGNLTGGVPQYKNQNEAKHLPLELSADEVTLAHSQGWITLQAETSRCLQPQAQAAQRKPTYATDPDWDAYHEYYQHFDPARGYTGSTLPVIGNKQRKLERARVRAECQAAGATPSARDASEPAWRASLRDKDASYPLPITATDAVQQRAQGVVKAGAGGGAAAVQTEVKSSRNIQQQQAVSGQAVGEAACAAVAVAEGAAPEPAGAGASVPWDYPSTPADRLRYTVFCDMHRQGFTMTGGSKFGADMLAYPGDPSLYHAQFTVRLVPPGAAMNPMLLKATARGSHAARKHLLLASLARDVAHGETPQLRYFSLAPEAGFGSKA